MEALLHVNHLEKNLDEFVLKDVNLTLQPGYIMGLIGVNGTGKTTLIQTILNLYKKDAGDVYVNGYSMEEQEREAKDQIGFVLDKNVFEESLSVWKNAKLFGKLYSRFDEEVFRECCERFQVPLNQKVGKLSTGYQVRFQLAFALSLFADTVSSMTPLVRGIIWGVCFLINLFFVVAYVGAFLKEILLYENVYCQRPKRDDVQYDIC